MFGSVLGVSLGSGLLLRLKTFRTFGRGGRSSSRDFLEVLELRNIVLGFSYYCYNIADVKLALICYQLSYEPFLLHFEWHCRLVRLHLADYVSLIYRVADLLAPLEDLARVHGGRQGGHAELDVRRESEEAGEGDDQLAIIEHNIKKKGTCKRNRAQYKLRDLSFLLWTTTLLSFSSLTLPLRKGLSPTPSAVSAFSPSSPRSSSPSFQPSRTPRRQGSGNRWTLTTGPVEQLFHQVHQQLKDYPYLFFPTPYEQYIYRSVCVKECPSKEGQKLKCKTNSQINSCQVNNSFQDISKQILSYPSALYKRWVCLPLIPVYFWRIKLGLQPEYLQSLNMDLTTLKSLLLTCVFIGVATIIIFLCFRDHQYFSKFLLYGAILMSVGLGLTCLIYVLVKQNQFNSFGKLNERSNQEHVYNWMSSYNSHYISSIVISCLLILLGILLSVFTYSNTVKLGIFHHFFKFVVSITPTFSFYLLVLVLTLLGVGISFGWAYFLVHLISIGKESNDPLKVANDKQELSSLSALFMALGCLSFLLVNNFYYYYQKFIYEALISNYYFGNGKASLLSILLDSFYHIGTFVKAAFITFFFSPLELVFKLLDVLNSGQVFKKKIIDRPVQECLSNILQGASQQSLFFTYIWSLQFSYGSQKFHRLNQLFRKETNVIRGGVVLIGWAAFLFSLLLPLSLWTCLVIFSQSQVTSYFNTITLFGFSLWTIADSFKCILVSQLWACVLGQLLLKRYQTNGLQGGQRAVGPVQAMEQIRAYSDFSK